MLLYLTGPWLQTIFALLDLCSLGSTCSLGLTQLRHQTLALMHCNPPKNEERDPCPAMIGGRESYCQVDDVDGNYVCCGTTELLVELLSTKKPKQLVDSLNKEVPESQVTQSITQYPIATSIATPATTLSTTESVQATWLPPVVSNLESSRQGSGYYVYPNPQKLESVNGLLTGEKPHGFASLGAAPTTPNRTFLEQKQHSFASAPLMTVSEQKHQSAESSWPTTASPSFNITPFQENHTQNYTLVLGPELTPFLASLFTNPNQDYKLKKSEENLDLRVDGPAAFRRITKEPLSVTLTNGSRVFSNLITVVEEDGPLLSLITGAEYKPGNITNTWLATSSVVLLQDGPCSIIVNTGLPVQRSEITASLAAKGITGNKLDYTVITSGLPQFIGNANLFPASQFIVGLLYAHWTTVALSNVPVLPFIDLCSSKTQIIHTPGPSPDAITVIARNVPAMGTVAITGALFIQDADIERVEKPFVWDVTELYTSRKKVICLSDWIIPAHSAPILVSRSLKKQAGCPST